MRRGRQNADPGNALFGVLRWARDIEIGILAECNGSVENVIPGRKLDPLEGALYDATLNRLRRCMNQDLAYEQCIPSITVSDEDARGFLKAIGVAPQEGNA